jgi:predicted lipid-binding transport protein (Tim44 family)
MTVEPPPVPAGWYPDPSRYGALRWWDGQRWTEITPPQAPAPQTPPPVYQPYPQQVASPHQQSAPAAPTSAVGVIGVVGGALLALIGLFFLTLIPLAIGQGQAAGAVGFGALALIAGGGGVGFIIVGVRRIRQGSTPNR